MSRRAKRQPISYEEFDSDIEIDEPLNQDKDTKDFLTDDWSEPSDKEKNVKGVVKTKKIALSKSKATASSKTTSAKLSASSKTASTKAPAANKTKQTKLNLSKITRPKAKSSPNTWNSKRIKELSTKYPDEYWLSHADTNYGMIGPINEDYQLKPIPCGINDQAAISSMCLSPDAKLLATFCNIGAVRIYDLEDNFKQLRKLRDTEEQNIDEFICGQFIGDYLAVGGKIKDRHVWSKEDDDNHILPCAIKIFDVVNCKVIARLEGHMEEILCIKSLTFMGENYLVSTSQDGYIFKWHMSADWSTLIKSTKVVDEVTCMAFNVSFLPNTGNKYFMASADEHVKLYDFEEGKLLQTFENLYSSYCDCVKFVKWLDEDKYLGKEDAMDIDDTPHHAWLITRGAELCDEDNNVKKPNICMLHKLVYPTKDGGEFKLEEVKRYEHEEYHSNSWLVSIASNGRYLLAPTVNGEIFVFNMLTGKNTAVIKEHQDMEVRDVIFHPYLPVIFSCGDDTCVKVYGYDLPDNQLEKWLGITEENSAK